MLMKLSIAAALAHHPKLLILDEATSGLDPVMRNEILDILLDFIQKNYIPYVFAGSRGALFALATLGNDAGIYGAAKMVLD